MAERAADGGQRFPLFPLNTVLFPGGPLPLRIFEKRYLDMVSECLREDRGFGVSLIREGAETGTPAATTVEIGTLARISDWNRLEDGLLGITAVGEQRFRLQAAEARADGLVMARATLLPPEPPRQVPQALQPLAELLRELLRRLEPLYGALPARYEDASWVGYRLAELLPLSPARRQQLLELEDAVQRLQQLDAVIRSFAEPGGG